MIFNSCSSCSCSACHIFVPVRGYAYQYDYDHFLPSSLITFFILFVFIYFCVSVRI